MTLDQISTQAQPHERTLFDKIIAREVPNFIVWEDEQYAAFLTPFANTPGVTVVAPKQNPGDYIFALESEQIVSLLMAAKKVAHILEKAFDVEHVALVFEGEAVPHVHAKLYPMHGLDKDRSDFPKQQVFMAQYPGYITTVEGPKMDDADLRTIQQKIQEVAQNEN